MLSAGCSMEMPGWSCPQGVHLMLHPVQSLEHQGAYKPRVITAKLSPDLPEYQVISKCTVDLELDTENKGLEGILYLNNGNGAL